MDKRSVLGIVGCVFLLARPTLAVTWERVTGGPSPGVRILGELPDCWFALERYWLESPGSGAMSDITYDVHGRVVAYKFAGTGNGYPIDTRVFGGTYNTLGQETSFFETRYYPDSGHTYGISVSDVSYDGFGNVEPGFSVTVQDTALDINDVWIVTEYELTDGVAIDTHPWDFEMGVWVDEPGELASIEFLKPGAPSVSGTFVEEEPGFLWVFEPPDYASLAALQADYPQGVYTLQFRDGSGGLLRTVALDYTVPAPQAAVEFTYPSQDGQTGVSTYPTFTWTVAPDAGDGLVAGVDDLTGDDTIYFVGPSPLTVTSWTPGPLLPNHAYDLNVDVANVKDWTGSDVPTMTVDGDEFYYELIFTYFNEISFATGEYASSPVYRFWSDSLGHHFYTISETEKDKLINQYAATWTYEGPAYQAFTTAGEPNTSAVYRFWSDRYKGHFYTISASEKDKLVNQYADTWAYEGPAFYAYPDGQQPGGTSPVYRFWSDALGGHFYTISASEKDKLVTQYADVWAYEGIAWYAYE